MDNYPEHHALRVEAHQLYMTAKEQGYWKFDGILAAVKTAIGIAKLDTAEKRNALEDFLTFQYATDIDLGHIRDHRGRKLVWIPGAAVRDGVLPDVIPEEEFQRMALEMESDSDSEEDEIAEAQRISFDDADEAPSTPPYAPVEPTSPPLMPKRHIAWYNAPPLADNLKPKKTIVKRVKRTKPLQYGTHDSAILALLECPVTLERMTRPLLLPCQHNFEQSVINQLADGVMPGRPIRCPLCRRESYPDQAVPNRALAAISAQFTQREQDYANGETDEEVESESEIEDEWF